MYIHQILNDQQKTRDSYRQETERRSQIVIRSGPGKESVLDYPDVYDYLVSLFPQVDISDVPIYRGSPASFKQAKWTGVGGLFIPWIATILVKDGSLGEESKYPRGRFARRMWEFNAVLENDDVVLHECLHAISHKSGRSSSKHTHMEEEFVYTNCVDYYRSFKGMTDDDIIKKIFLPFCVQDIVSVRKEIDVILGRLWQSGVPRIDYWDLAKYNRKELSKFRNKNADFLVNEIVKAAELRGKQMIECYENFGRGNVLSSESEISDVGMRIASINMDSDL